MEPPPGVSAEEYQRRILAAAKPQKLQISVGEVGIEEVEKELTDLLSKKETEKALLVLYQSFTNFSNKKQIDSVERLLPFTHKIAKWMLENQRTIAWQEGRSFSAIQLYAEVQRIWLPDLSQRAQISFFQGIIEFSRDFPTEHLKYLCLRLLHLESSKEAVGHLNRIELQTIDEKQGMLKSSRQEYCRMVFSEFANSLHLAWHNKDQQAVQQAVLKQMELILQFIDSLEEKQLFDISCEGYRLLEAILLWDSRGQPMELIRGWHREKNIYNRSFKTGRLASQQSVQPPEQAKLLYFREKFLAIKKSAKSSQEFSDQIQPLIQEIYGHCRQLLGRPPTPISIVGKGSLSRRELNSGSDQDLAALVLDSDERLECLKKYYIEPFLRLAQFYFDALDGNWIIVPPHGSYIAVGMRLEGADIEELISVNASLLQTPEGLANWVFSFDERKYESAYGLLNTVPLYATEGGEELHLCFKAALEKGFATHLSQRQIGEKFLALHQQQFNDRLTPEIGRELFYGAGEVNLKKRIIRPLTLLCFDLALYFNLLKNPKTNELETNGCLNGALDTQTILARLNNHLPEHFVAALQRSLQVLHSIRSRLQSIRQHRADAGDPNSALSPSGNLNRIHESIREYLDRLTEAEWVQIREIEEKLLEPTFKSIALLPMIEAEWVRIQEIEEQLLEPTFKSITLLPTYQGICFDPILETIKLSLRDSSYSLTDLHSEIKKLIGKGMLFLKDPCPPLETFLLPYLEYYKSFSNFKEKTACMTLYFRFLPFYLSETQLKSFVHSLANEPATDGWRLGQEIERAQFFYSLKPLFKELNPRFPYEVTVVQCDLDHPEQFVPKIYGFTAQALAQVLEKVDGQWRFKSAPADQIPCNHTVLPLQDTAGNILCWIKICPEQPAMEEFIYQIAWRYMGGGVVPSLTLSLRIGGYTVCATLTSHVKGVRLTEAGNKADRIHPRSYSQAFGRAVISSPGDDRGEDYYLVPSRFEQDQYDLVRIDNERLFYPDFKQGYFWSTLNVRTIIYCMDGLKQPIDRETFAHLKTIHPQNLMDSLFGFLSTLETFYRVLFPEKSIVNSHLKQQELSTKLGFLKNEFSFPVVYFGTDLVELIYRRTLSLFAAYQSETEEVLQTPEHLLSVVHHSLHLKYKRAWEYALSSTNPLHPSFQRFDFMGLCEKHGLISKSSHTSLAEAQQSQWVKIPLKDDDIIAAFEQRANSSKQALEKLCDLQTKNFQTCLALLKREDEGFIGEFSRLLPGHRSQVLIDAVKTATEKQKKLILQGFIQTEDVTHQFTFTDFGDVLDDTLLLSFLNKHGKNLNQLYLTGGYRLSLKSISNVSKLCPNLSVLVWEGCHLEKIGDNDGIAFSGALSFPSLTYLNLNRSSNLKLLNINARLLHRLIVRSSPNLSYLQTCSEFLREVCLEGCTSLTSEALQKLCLDFTLLTQLKCPNAFSKDQQAIFTSFPFTLRWPHLNPHILVALLQGLIKLEDTLHAKFYSLSYKKQQIIINYLDRLFVVLQQASCQLLNELQDSSNILNWQRNACWISKTEIDSAIKVLLTVIEKETSGYSDAKVEALRSLATLGCDIDKFVNVDILLTDLKNKDPGVRLRAAKVMSEIRFESPVVVFALAALVEDENQHVRLMALLALVRRGKQSAFLTYIIAELTKKEIFIPNHLILELIKGKIFLLIPGLLARLPAPRQNMVSSGPDVFVTASFETYLERLEDLERLLNEKEGRPFELVTSLLKFINDTNLLKSMNDDDSLFRLEADNILIKLVNNLSELVKNLCENSTSLYNADRVKNYSISLLIEIIENKDLILSALRSLGFFDEKPVTNTPTNTSLFNRPLLGVRDRHDWTADERRKILRAFSESEEMFTKLIYGLISAEIDVKNINKTIVTLIFIRNKTSKVDEIVKKALEHSDPRIRDHAKIILSAFEQLNRPIVTELKPPSEEDPLGGSSLSFDVGALRKKLRGWFWFNQSETVLSTRDRSLEKLEGLKKGLQDPHWPTRNKSAKDLVKLFESINIIDVLTSDTDLLRQFCGAIEPESVFFSLLMGVLAEFDEKESKSQPVALRGKQ